MKGVNQRAKTDGRWHLQAILALGNQVWWPGVCFRSPWQPISGVVKEIGSIFAAAADVFLLLIESSSLCVQQQQHGFVIGGKARKRGKKIDQNPA